MGRTDVPGSRPADAQAVAQRAGAGARRRDAVLRLLGLARRADALRLGTEGVLRALRTERPGCVFLARDAGKDARKRVVRALGRSRLDDRLFDGQTLATAFHRATLSVVSVHERGFVAGLEKLLSD
jgi:hypothetical protein